MAIGKALSRDEPVLADSRISGNGSWLSSVVKFARRKPLSAFGGLITLLLIVVAIFHPWIATHDPNKLFTNDVLSGLSGTHLFGTDNFGRDVFSRVVYGAWTSLEVSIIAVFIGTVLGTAIGVASGYLAVLPTWCCSAWSMRPWPFLA